MKHILALDGGGIRGVFTLEILLKVEELLREHYRKTDPAKAANFVLRDHFDFFAGTSTGAIIATLLCWGKPVKEILDLYVEQGKKIFDPVPRYRFIERYFMAKFSPERLGEILQDLFLEVDGRPVKRDKDGKPIEAGKTADLGSPHLLRSQDRELRKYLQVVVRNHTNGSAWPLTNNPDAKYNDRARPDCNLQIPLWKLVRASTAAPVYFPPEVVQLGDTKAIFVDGSVTPYSNPAAIAALTAILPGYRICWQAGPEKIRLISVGTIQFSSELRGKLRIWERLRNYFRPDDSKPIEVKNPRLWLGYYAKHIPDAMLQGAAWQQDYLCRCLGQCMFGEELDREVGDIRHDEVAFPHAWFSYVRYNETFKKNRLKEILKEDPHLADIDNQEAVPRLRKIGRRYAEENVKLWHLI